MEILTKKNILVIQTAFLGDAILTLPMIQKIKELFPHSEITVLCIPAAAEIFYHSPFIKDVIEFDKKGAQRSIFNFIKLLLKVRSRKFTMVYSPHRSFRSALVAFFSRAEITIGFDTSASPFLYKKNVKYRNDLHEVARNLELIGFDTSNNKWKIMPIIEIPEETKRKISDMAHLFKSPQTIAVAPGSVWNTKIYPKEYFTEIIRLLVAKKYSIILIGGKEDQLLCVEIEKEFNSDVFSVAGKVNVIESIELLKNCSALICNDSAPTHLAMIANISVLTIYCSTIPDFGFYPYNENSGIVSYNDLQCKPCGIHGHKECPIKTFDCGLNLLPQEVIAKFEKIISA